jgi:hypothetical protein
MQEQSAREPLLDGEKLEPVENVQVQDGIHEQNGKLYAAFSVHWLCQLFSLTFALLRFPLNRSNNRFQSSWIIVGRGHL